MKKLFDLVQLSARIFFLVGFAAYFFWQEPGVQFSAETRIMALQFMVFSAPVMIATTFIRWKYKWPTTVDWFTLALAVASGVWFVYSLRALLFIFGDDSSPLLMKIVLPALVPILSAVAFWAVIKWYHDRSSQQPAVQPADPSQPEK